MIDSALFDDLRTVLQNRPAVANRLMFGTDYWVVLPAGNLVEHQQLFLTYLKEYKEHFISKNTHDFLFKV